MKGVGKPFRDKNQAEKKHVMKSKELEKKEMFFIHISPARGQVFDKSPR